MELFNKKYVHFIWDDSLAGKDAFFSDHIDDLQDYVNKHNHLSCMVQSSGDPSYPFSTGGGSGAYRFIYYDPNYNYKLAFSKGDTVEMCINKSKNTWIPVKDLDDLDDPTGTYRINIKAEEVQEELVTYRSKINMELFNKKYVHFMWDDSLDGKDAFFSDSITDLQDHVNNNNTKYVKTVHCGEDHYPFNAPDFYNWSFKFVYYDPNYKYKLAFSKGDTVEMLPNKSRATWLTAKDLADLDDPTCVYRIKKSEKLVTYEELAQWLTKGNGLVMDNTICKVSTVIDLNTNPLDAEVSKDYLIRRYGEKEWHKPTKKYVYNK